MHHYRCWRVFVTKTNAIRTSDTVHFEDNLETGHPYDPYKTATLAANDLARALEPHLSKNDTKTIQALRALKDIFNTNAANMGKTTKKEVTTPNESRILTRSHHRDDNDDRDDPIETRDTAQRVGQRNPIASPNYTSQRVGRDYPIDTRPISQRVGRDYPIDTNPKDTVQRVIPIINDGPATRLRSRTISRGYRTPYQLRQGLFCGLSCGGDVNAITHRFQFTKPKESVST